MRIFFPKRAYWLVPLKILRQDSLFVFMRGFVTVLKYAPTEPTEYFMSATMFLNAVTLWKLSENVYMHPTKVWAVACALSSFLLLMGVLSKDSAGRMWAGFIMFYLRMWIAVLAFKAEPPDLHWAGAAIGAVVSLWMFFRYYCALLTVKHVKAAKRDNRTTIRRSSDFQGLTGDL